MADIDSPEVINYINEVIRPHAEKMRALKTTIDAALVTWYSQISALCPNDSSPVADGRELEGVSRLLGSDVVGLVTQMELYKTACDSVGVANVISKPCVRSLTTN